MVLIDHIPHRGVLGDMTVEQLQALVSAVVLRDSDLHSNLEALCDDLATVEVLCNVIDELSTVINRLLRAANTTNDDVAELCFRAAWAKVMA